MARRHTILLAIALLAGAAPTAPAQVGGRSVIVYDGSGTMRIRFHGTIWTPSGWRGPGSRYPFWWWGYEWPGPSQEGEGMDPALNAPGTLIHNFVYRGMLDGGYYDTFPYTGHVRLFSPFTYSWAALGPGVWSPWWRQPGSYDGPTIVGRALKVDPALLGTQVPAGPAFEVVEPLPFQPTVVKLLQDGAYEGALDMWRRARSGAPLEASGAPKYPGDEPDAIPVAIDEVWWADDRLYAVALAGAGRLEAAAQIVDDAYLADPTLASLPLAGEAIATDSSALRRLVLQAIDHAERSPSPGAWLLAAMLTQAEGRSAIAGKFLSRAEAAGLDAEVARAMNDALTTPPSPAR